ncbi:MAG: class I tRNA ligase family protein [Deltaproteobacteria bacterium]|nr:class I tRNA ligase family protein [Deltaproteobacteria bacterium]
MLKLFNSLGKRIEPFRPVDDKVVNIFTCGPSIYQRAHIGNFRTFLFEDVLVRYLEYSGYAVKRGMNFTDIEDKAIKEAEKRKMTVKQLTKENIKDFMEEMSLLRMKTPEYLPKASEAVDEAVEIIELLLDREIAYRHGGNIYFDPLNFPGFGRLYGLDMTKWPTRKRRFHRDTYPGMQWNLGDFILWHECRGGDPVCWDTRIGRGRPSWNIQDPSMVSKYFQETLSIYCGGFDNLFRHHDYTRAILESIRPYPMAKFWLHCHHLQVNGQKMSKSKGNIYYTDTLIEQGYDMGEIRFFLIYGHYREKLDYSDNTMRSAADRLRKFREMVKEVEGRADQEAELEWKVARRMKRVFAESMDDDLDVRRAFDGLYGVLSQLEFGELKPTEASGAMKALRQIDGVLRVIF